MKREWTIAALLLFGIAGEILQRDHRQRRDLRRRIAPAGNPLPDTCKPGANHDPGRQHHGQRKPPSARAG